MFRHNLALTKHESFVTYGLQRNMGISPCIVVVRTVLMWFDIMSCLFMLLDVSWFSV
ncbi:hypothetical protein Hanom_Chr07g00654941 [Helianthus anomalus]